MNKIFSILALALAVGCSSISVDYQGENGASAPTSALILSEPPAGAVKLGSAVATSKAEEVGRKLLEDALVEKADKVGADYVVVTNYRVAPRRMNRLLWEDSAEIWANESAETSNWDYMERDFDGGYGSADLSFLGLGGGNTSQPQVYYQRTLFADFYAK